jgi:hypothetical protein
VADETFCYAQHLSPEEDVHEMAQWLFDEFMVFELRIIVWIPISLPAFAITDFVMAASIDPGE